MRTWRSARGTRIEPHVVIKGPTVIGVDNHIFQFASIGDDPQDKKYKRSERTRLVIGDRNTIRECCTLNRGTVQDQGVTTIGNDNWIMAYCHVAHDCIVGNNTIFANNASIAGHVWVGDYAILGGFTAVHQFCRIGAHSLCEHVQLRDEGRPGLRHDLGTACRAARHQLGRARSAATSRPSRSATFARRIASSTASR